jgi:hypothetical protein
MKKSTPKLTLHRETLRALEQPQFEAVEGGVSASACVATCIDCSARRTCAC